MAIVRWDPWGESLRMASDLDRIFGRLGQGERGGQGMAWMPKIDVKRSGDDVMVRAELPGIKPEDVDIELTDNVLTIKGERKTEEEKEDEGWLIRESSYGSFERSLSIPEGVDPSAIQANLDNGVLEVKVPKAFEASKPRTTRIEIGQQTQMQLGQQGQGDQSRHGDTQMAEKGTQGAGGQHEKKGGRAASEQKHGDGKRREAEREMVRTTRDEG